MEFFRQEYWSGLLFLPPGDLCNSGIEPRSPSLQVDSLPSESPGKPLQLRELKHKETDVELRTKKKTKKPMKITVRGALGGGRSQVRSA